LWGLLSPAGLLGFVARWQARWELWLGTLLRLVFGLALWLVAPASRFPVVLQALGVVSIIAGGALPFMGVARFQALVTWWCEQSPGFTQVWAASAAAVGLFVLWAVV
jgi:hypothetical protein